MRRFMIPALRALCFGALLLALGACEKAGYPDAPPGYDYRTVHVRWEMKGDPSGTRELYAETSGYKDGELLYKRVAGSRNIERGIPGKPGETAKEHIRYFNIEGKNYNVIEEMRAVGVTMVEMAPLMRIHRANAWLAIIRLLIPREDLTQEQRLELQRKIFNLSDDDLRKLGAKIDEEELMGVTTKHFDIPIAKGKAELWMYGDLPLK
ncbi:MAG: hypothetical protein ACE5FC_01685, partial [Myxococcota bacterium]